MQGYGFLNVLRRYNCLEVCLVVLTECVLLRIWNAFSCYYRMCSLATIECVLLLLWNVFSCYYRMCSLAAIECVLLLL